jgi:hypothetical protein
MKRPSRQPTSPLVSWSLVTSTTVILRSRMPGGLTQRSRCSRLQTRNDLQVPVIPLRPARRHPYLMEQTAAGRRCVVEGWIHASKVPIRSALRPRIHSASGGPEAPSANPRMAVAARAVQYCAFHRARRAGSGTAGRTPAPLFAFTPLIGAKALCFGSTVIELAPITMPARSQRRLAFS